MTALRTLIIDLNVITLRAGLLAISTGLLFVLLASGCGTAESQVPQAALLSTAAPSLVMTATPSLVMTATPPPQVASPSETPGPDVADAEPEDEYENGNLPAESDVLRDAVRAQVASDSFRIAHTYNQVKKNLSTGDVSEHPYTSTAEIVPPDKMHYLSVSNMFETDLGRVSEIYVLDGMEYRHEQREDLSYHWVKSPAVGTPFDLFQVAYSFWNHSDQMVPVGTELLDGMDTQIYQYVDDREGFKQTERVWISVDDGLLRKVELTISTFDWHNRKAEAAIDTFATFVFYDYNADIRIEAPVEAP
jgi:hypothetical protein